MTTSTLENHRIASINGNALHSADETLSPDELRQRACSELLRQAAVAQSLLSADDLPSADGVLSEAASTAIEALLELKLLIPEPSPERLASATTPHIRPAYATGERVNIRHILFAVTEGVDVALLRNRAETCLLNVRCHDGTRQDDQFAKDANNLSNCPSGSDGGHLGWLTHSDCAPEFAKEIFGNKEIGVLPRLVHSRFGLHVVEVLAREPGKDQPFESVRGAVAMALRQKTYVTALRQYLSLLAGNAVLEGVDMDAADSALVQ
ncbi:MAG: peptidylprolyl isomerase [Comamonadaceae bacterium]|nr:peptidylprolyl isomerase [Comamonadaceae bacterium]